MRDIYDDAQRSYRGQPLAAQRARGRQASGFVAAPRRPPGGAPNAARARDFRRGRDAGLPDAPRTDPYVQDCCISAPTSDTWRQSARSDADAGSSHSESIDRPPA